MELINNLPAYRNYGVMSLNSGDLNGNVVDNETSNQSVKVNVTEIKTLLNHTAFPSTNPTTASTPVLTMVEDLSLPYEEVQTPDEDVEMTMAAQDELVDTTADTLEDVRNNVKNNTLSLKSAASQLTGSARALKTTVATASTIDTGTSYAELWARIAADTALIKSDYVDFYADLMQKFTEMYQAFNETCQKASSSAVSSGDDGNNVKFNTGTMQTGYNDFYNKIVPIENSLGSVKNWSSMQSDERENMLATLQPAFSVDSNTGRIWFNLDQYNTVKNTMPSGISSGKVSTASYQAWLATFNAAGSAFQSNMQSFAQRYSQSNSTFDNLNKVLSSAISSLADSAKEVLKSLA